MIKIFNENDTDFSSNGNIAINPIKCIEVKENSLNGWYLEVEVPSSFKSDIKQDMLCVVQTKSKARSQAFRIKNVKSTRLKLIFKAEHVMFDARDYFLVDVRPSNLSAVGALRYINERTDRLSPFTVTSDVNNSSTAYFIRKNLLEAWTVIEERWGGAFDADNFDIKLSKKLGNDNGESLSYGADLIDVQVMEDWSNVVTRLYPTGPNGIMLPEKYIDSTIAYPTPYTRNVAFETEIEDDEPPLNELIVELRENAIRHIETNQYPMVSYVVKSNVKEHLEIGDTIEVKHPLVTIQTEVQKYKYDILTKRVLELEFGNYSRDVKKRFESIKEDIKTTKEKVSTNEYLIGHQTEMINQLNKNGYVYIDDNEILILDKLPKSTAKNVWRFGLGGIGFSSNGYEGPFEFAFTSDGKLNTDFILANSIMTNHLSSDVGVSLDLTSNTSINQIVSGIHQGNNIPNLNGNIDLVGWQGTTGRLKGITVPYRIKGIQNLRGNMNAYPVQSKQFLSTWGLEFYGPGEMISPSGAIVTDGEYSWKGRILPFKPFTVKAYEQKEYGYDLYLENPLQQGSLNQNTGLELDSDNRVRSSKFLKVSSGTLDIIKSNANFNYLVRMYDSNYEFLSGSQPWISDTNKSVSLNKGTQYIKIVIGRTNNANITPEDIPSELLSIYDENARPFKETEFKFDSPQEYNQFTMQPHNETKFVRLGFSIPNATLDSRVTLTEMMFNMGQPKDWFASPNDIKALTESYRLQTANEIKDVVKNVEVIDGKTVENYTIIQQLSNQIVLAVNSQGRLVAVELGVDPNTGSYIVLKADNISLEGLTTINGGFKVLENGNIEFVDAIGRNVDISGRITAISGEIGGYTISGSNLVGNDVTLGKNEIFLKNARISSGQNTDHIYIYGRGLYIGENNSGSVISGSARALTFSVPGTTFSPVMYNDNQSRGLFDNITPFNGSASAKYLGSSGKRYTNIYLTNQPNVSSDERHKKNILDIDNDLIQIFGQEVKPKTYMMNGSHEIHFGYIAQDVERALFKYNLRKHGLNRANLMMEEFAVLSKDESYMSLLYGEIAVIMDAYNRKRSDDLEKRIKKIEEVLLERNG